MNYSNVYHSYLLDRDYANLLAEIYGFKDDMLHRVRIALLRNDLMNALSCYEHLYDSFCRFYETSGIQHARLAEDILEICEQLAILDHDRAPMLTSVYCWYRGIFPGLPAQEKKRTRRIELIVQKKVDRGILYAGAGYSDVAADEKQFDRFIRPGGEIPPLPRVLPGLQGPRESAHRSSIDPSPGVSYWHARGAGNRDRYEEPALTPAAPWNETAPVASPLEPLEAQGPEPSPPHSLCGPRAGEISSRGPGEPGRLETPAMPAGMLIARWILPILAEILRTLSSFSSRMAQGLEGIARAPGRLLIGFKQHLASRTARIQGIPGKAPPLPAERRAIIRIQGKAALPYTLYDMLHPLPKNPTEKKDET